MLNRLPAAITSAADMAQHNRLTQPSLWALLANEWRFYRRQPLFWLAWLLGLAFAALVTVGNAQPTAQPYKELLFTHTQLLMTLQVLLIGALAPLAFLRDRQYGMAELTGVTPLTNLQWCLSRAGGLLMLALGLQILLLLLVALGVWLGNTSAPETTSIGSLAWFSLQLLVLQQLPALFWLVALQLWCSRNTEHTALLYLLTAVCWLGYMLLAIATGSPVMANGQQVSPWLFQLMLFLDPYALTPWLAQLQQSQSMDPGWPVLLNRLLIVSISFLLCWRALAAGQLPVRSPSGTATARAFTKLSSMSSTPHLHPPQFGGSTAANPQQGLATSAAGWQSFSRLWQLQGLQLLRQRSTILALLLLTGLTFSEVVTGLGYAETLSRLLPDSRDALNRVNWDVLPRFGILLVALWASQLSWLNRQLRCDSLIAAMPVNGWVQLASQLATLWLMTVLMVVLTFSAVACGQLLAKSPIQLAEYSQQGLFVLLPLLQWGMLLLACHALLRSPLRANTLVVILLLLGLSPLPEMLELSHPLWRVGQTQLQMPDALWGYQGSAGGITAGGDLMQGGFWPYLLFWTLLALTLWLLALQGYHRGTGHSAPRRRLSHPLTLSSAVLALLWLTQGLQLHQQLQQAGALETSQQRQAQRAAYEQQYQHWQQQPQPVVSQVRLEVDVFPVEQQTKIQASLTLTNPHPTAISQLLLTLPGGMAEQQALRDIKLQGATLAPQNVTSPDRSQLQRIYQFSQPLAPGATTELKVQLQLKQQAIAPAPTHQVLRQEFSYVRLFQLLPQPGFMPELRLRDTSSRAEFGLAPLPATAIQSSVLAATATPATARYDWVQLETTVSVPLGYQGLAAGKLIRQWQAQGRQHFHYQTSAAIRNLPAVIAVPWQPRQTMQHNVSLEIYSPYHNAATDLTQQAMQQTLHWFSTHIGAYPGDALRLVMMPDLGPTGYALPQLVLINHRVGLRASTAPDAGFSQVYRRAVHEVAHQWFGHGIGNGVPGDGAFLVESLAKYAELVLIEQHFGVAAMQALVDFEQQRYSRAQAGSRAEQSSLIDAAESYDQYSRATLVFAKLRATVGDAVINKALRQVWQQHRYPATPASAMDFVRALQASSPSSAQPLINSLLLTKDIRLLLRETE